MKEFILLLIIISTTSAYFHGNGHNSKQGATCAEFLYKNHMDSCCSGRNDECYMIHFDARCYCDQFCGKNSTSDCCPDVVRQNNANRCPVKVGVCKKNGLVYQNGQKFMDNCNRCQCRNGHVECKKKSCLINPYLLNQINRKNYGWKAGNYSFFWSKSLEFGYMHFLGVELPSLKQRSLTSDPYEHVQKYYDFRNEPYFGGNGIPNSIKNQGMCSASWAFSITDVIQDRLSKYKKISLNKTPSVEQLIACNSINKKRNKCSSLPVDQAWSSVRYMAGIVDTECYSNKNVQSGFIFSCKIKNDTCPDSVNMTKKFHISKAYPVPSVDKSIMKEILRNGPVQMVFKVHDDFFMYKSGIYAPIWQNWSLMQSNYHAVKVLGWGSEKGVDFWLAANSWGPDWGEKGYFRIRRDAYSTEIGRHVYGAWVSIY